VCAFALKPAPGPPAGLIVKVTVKPAPTGLPPASFTVAASAAKAVLTGTVCGVPLVATTVAGVPERLVSEKVVDAPPAMDAVTVNEPGVPLAVSVGAFT